MEKKKLLKPQILLALLLLSQITAAQIKISGELRPRTEFRNGFKTLIQENSDPAFFTEQRTRIKLNFASDKIFAKISLQDVRFWGAVDQVYKSDPSLTNLHEAFAAYKISKKFSLGAGRTELDYDNARILGNLAWAQQSRSHDVFLFTFQDSTMALHAGAAFNQDARTAEPAKLTRTFYSGVNNYKAIQFLWFHKDFNKIGLSVLALNNGLQTGVQDTSDVEFSQTIGFYGAKTKGTLKGTLEAYYQMGKDGKGKDLAAWLFSASVSYSVGKIPVTLGADLLSGTKAGETKNTSFTPFYGTNHKFYGFMDYFYVGNAHRNAGLTDIFLSSKIPLFKNLTVSPFIHQFMSAVDVVNTSGETLSKNLGTEIDIVFNAKLADNVALEFGYSQMFGTKSLEVIKNLENTNVSGINNWTYLMISFTPVFFSK